MRQLPWLSCAAPLLLAAACGGDLSPPSGPQCDSTIWTETLVATMPDPGSPPDELTGQCLSRSPNVSAAGLPSCIVLEGRHGGGACPPCDPAAARVPVPTANAGAVDLARSSTTATQDSLDCFCEVPLLQGSGETACQSDLGDPVLVDGVQQDGICYVDATTMPPLGNPDLTSHCQATDKRLLRFLGKARPVATASTGTVAVFMVCEADACQAAP